MFWTCPALTLFWKSVFDSLSAITSAIICPSPLVAMFGILPSGHRLPSYFVELVAFHTLLARRVILLHWKNLNAPSHSVWIRSVLYFMKLEKIKHFLRGTVIKFSKIWEHFLNHVRSLQLDPAAND